MSESTGQPNPKVIALLTVHPLPGRLTTVFHIVYRLIRRGKNEISDIF